MLEDPLRRQNSLFGADLKRTLFLRAVGFNDGRRISSKDGAAFCFENLSIHKSHGLDQLAMLGRSGKP